MKKGFAFVQFLSNREAQSAIDGESGQILKGKKIGEWIYPGLWIQWPRNYLHLAWG